MRLNNDEQFPTVAAPKVNSQARRTVERLFFKACHRLQEDRSKLATFKGFIICIPFALVRLVCHLENLDTFKAL